MISLSIFEYQVKLFGTNLEPVNRLTYKIKKDRGLDEGEINTIRRKIKLRWPKISFKFNFTYRENRTETFI